MCCRCAPGPRNLPPPVAAASNLSSSSCHKCGYCERVVSGPVHTTHREAEQRCERTHQHTAIIKWTNAHVATPYQWWRRVSLHVESKKLDASAQVPNTSRNAPAKGNIAYVAVRRIRVPRRRFCRRHRGGCRLCIAHECAGTANATSAHRTLLAR